MRTLKVAIVSTNSDLAGAPIYTSILGRQLKEFGHTPYFIFGSRGPVSSDLISDGFSVHFLKNLSSAFTPFRDFFNLIYLCKILKHLSVDIVHLNSSKAGFVGRIACFALQIPCVYTVHGWGFGRGKPVFQNVSSFIIEFLLSFAISRYICVSRTDVRIAISMLRISERKVSHIYNGVPDLNFKPFIDCVPEYDCLMLARVHPQKDHSTLFNALALRPFTLVLAGHGTDDQEFVSLANNILNKSSDKISFLGPRTDIPRLISKANVVILASIYEALPISLIEALRAGKPIVATDVGDVSAIVSHGFNGYLCDVQNSSQLSHSIFNILDNPDLAVSMGQASRRLYEQRFSASSMINKVLSVYHDI